MKSSVGSFWWCGPVWLPRLYVDKAEPTCRYQVWWVTSALAPLQCVEGGHGVWTLKIEINGSSEPTNVPLPTTGKGPMGLRQCSCSKGPMCWWCRELAGNSGAPGVFSFRWESNSLSLLKSDASVFLQMMCPFSALPELAAVTPLTIHLHSTH